jgi:uncharacterized membrane protein YdfJ with MMPL/SSD domain
VLGLRIVDLPVRRPVATILVALAFGTVAAFFGAGTPHLLGRASNDFAAQGSESTRADAVIERASGLSATPAVLVLVRNPTGARLARVSDAIRVDPVFPVVAPPLRSRDTRSAIVPAYARAADSQSTWRSASQRLAARLAPVPGVAVGGTALATVQVNDQVQHDLTRAELLAFPVLFVLALLVFRSLVAAMLPLATGGLTILGALLLLRVLNLVTPVSSYALNIVTGAGLGLGIDYSLLLVSRYREELARLGPGAAAVRATMRTAGRTVAFSSITVGASIATLSVFPLGFLRSMGIAGGLVGPLAGLIALTLLPALFMLIGRRIDLLSVPHRRRREQDGGWYRLAHLIMRRPWPFALASAAVLIVLSLPFGSIRFTGVDASVLPRHASARVVDTALSTGFRTSLTTPAYAVIDGSRSNAAAFATAIRRSPDATVVQPPRRLAARTWVVDASSGAPFLAARSTRLVETMRAEPGGALVGGATAQFLDQKHAIGSNLPLAGVLLCLATFALLAVATRSLVLPLKALVMNALTLGATLGVLVFVFQDGRLEGPLHYDGQGALQLTMPVLLFAVSFGLATDYGVFLLTRIKEGWDEGLTNSEAVALGLERTGRIVTAAALLFCVAMSAFATSGVILIKEVGASIALAVAIDASIVRALLVPALMAILGRWNWWPSRNVGRRS